MNLFHIFLAIATMLAMELAVTLFHKHVMHGIGWKWHQSHHQASKNGGWEKNDLYTIVFSIATFLLFVLGGMHAPLWWVALGRIDVESNRESGTVFRVCLTRDHD